MSQTAWAFDNAEYADARIILTTESPEKCKARLSAVDESSSKRIALDERAGGPAPPEVRSSVSFLDSTAAVTFHCHEELPGHRVILSSASEFFQTLFRWDRQAADPENPLKRHREQAPVAVVSVKSQEWLPIARSMLRFIYTKELEEGTSRTELLQLYQLSDEYRITALRRACLEGLAAVEVPEWDVGEKQLLCSLAGTVVADEGSKCAELARAAAAVCSGLVAEFLQLEVAWNSKARRDMFCALPQQLVVRVAREDRIVVRSENTVLVAVLSWLRSAAGKAAVEAGRREVLQCVRLSQLSPWFLTWALFSVEEVGQLLPRLALAKAVQYSSSSQTAQRQLVECSKLLQGWNVERSSAGAGMTGQVRLVAPISKLADMVAECKASKKAVALVSPRAHFNGLIWTAAVRVTWLEGGNVQVRAAVYANLEVAEQPLANQPDLLNAAYDASVTWFGSACGRTEWVHAGPAPLGIGWGIHLVEKLESDDSLQSRLSNSLRGDVLEMQVTVRS